LHLKKLSWPRVDEEILKNYGFLIADLSNKNNPKSEILLIDL